MEFPAAPRSRNSKPQTRHLEALGGTMTRPLPLETPESASHVSAGVFLIAALEILAICAAVAVLTSILANLP
jgi:hypothetical protein